MTVLAAAAGTLAYLGAGEAVKRCLDRWTGRESGTGTVLAWPLVALGEGALFGALWLLGRSDGQDAPAAPLGWQALKDDGGWLFPEEARLRARAVCAELGHDSRDIVAHDSRVTVARYCVRCGERLPDPTGEYDDDPDY